VEQSRDKAVPYIVHEGELFRMERINKRLTWALLAALAVAAGALVALIVR
jgi:hypothetical protein